MNIEQKIFGRRRLLSAELIKYGFTENTDALIYEKSLMDGDFTARITVHNRTLRGEVLDDFTGEEYTPIRVEAQVGAYVGAVRAEYMALLEDIAAKCTVEMPFRLDQSNRIADAIEARYGDEPVRMFEKNPGFGVFRHAKSGKWYALIMDVERKKFDTDGDETLSEIMNVKIDPATLDALLEVDGIYRCYHMNKKQWVSIELDGRVPDEQILEMLELSHQLTDKGSASRRKKTADGTVTEDPSYWIIPANPSNFDIIEGFAAAADHALIWHQRIKALPGDIVYIYHTNPVGALRFRTVVLESDIDMQGHPYYRGKPGMKLQLTDTYDVSLYPRAWLNEHGIAKTVRGQRSAPAELVEILEK